MSVLDDTKAILAELIAFPTVSSDSNLDLIAWCAGRLEALGARCEVSRDATGAKANLFATIGPDVDGGVVLSGHTDVVPVEGQEWSNDPFEAVERDGLIYGRGSCDMKGFIACALALAPRIAAADLKRPVHFALSYDEEVGCLGAQVMLKALEASGRRPGICIIGEPTEMRIIEGHKGCYEYTTRFNGLAGHSAAVVALGNFMIGKHRLVKMLRVDVFQHSRLVRFHRIKVGQLLPLAFVAGVVQSVLFA